MLGLLDFYLAHPFWVWLTVAALLLSVEVATGTGWLFWPVASAAVCGAITALVRLGVGLELGLFAVLTVGFILLARRYFPPGRARPLPHSDNRINGLIGREGMVVEVFTNGHGVVLVHGQEWPAEADRQRPLDLGAAIRVELAIDGMRLRVCQA